MMSDRPDLTIAFSTMPSRVREISFPERKANQELLVVVQNVNEASYLIEEHSARLVEMKSLGVAKSRNAAIQRARGRYLHFADDDIQIVESGLAEVVEYLDSNPDCSIVLAQASDETGALRKNYETKITPLRLTNSARAATYEMVIRLDSIRESMITFDERFGAGAELYLGDEYIFIADALRAGLSGVHFPVVIARHPKESSGSKWGSDTDLAVRSEVFSRVFGWRAPFIRLAFLIKTKNEFPGLKKSLKFILRK